MMSRLITKSEYDGMAPFAQGYIVGCQANTEGSPLKGLENHYEEKTSEQEAWQAGFKQAQIVAQRD